MRVAPEIVLTNDERAELTRLKQSKETSAWLAQRARIILLAARGMRNKEIAAELDVGRVQVARWRERYARFRLAGIERDLPRGAPPSAVDVARLIRMTTQSSPEPGKPWSARALAAALGISAASVSRHWRANGLKPPQPARSARREPVTEPTEPIEDVVALYFSPPGRALVLCFDEAGAAPTPDDKPAKGQARATGAPNARGSHDFLGLHAALTALERKTAASQKPPQDPVGWLRFLKLVDRETPKGRTLHLIAGNDTLHSHPAVQKWFAGHRRFTMHVTSTPPSWRTAVERFLRNMGNGQLRVHGLASVPALIAGIEDYVGRPDAEPRPFIWTREGGVAQRPVGANGRLNSLKNGAPYPNRTRTAGAPDAQSGVAAEGDNLRDKVYMLKRERILQVSARLFFERGYLQTSVDAIAERLGATKPFVYYHFKSKSDILIEICEHSTRSVLAAAENAMSTKGSAWLRLEQFLREFTNVVLQEHQLVAIYFREDINLPQEAAERINQMRKSVDRRISALLSEGIDTGEFEIEDPRIGALVIAGMSSYAFAWYRERGRLDQLEVANRIVRMALKLVKPTPKQRTAYNIHSVATA